ncbi:unnamed protein product [Prorocentrum cordatum]|uniref:Uncharacterized protein n=1 Tax=Prorocentrum cordatum TaxID=2364126 RepID=A0ABN9SYE7_9DINO|nr:unnamed protein product [Polarella glacialis]
MMRLRLPACHLALLAGCVGSAGARLRLASPSLVGDGKGGDHPCVAVMRETQAVCKPEPYGKSSDQCNFALCHTADLNRGRCADVVTTGAPKSVNFPDDLDKLLDFHAVDCQDGGQGGKGVRNAMYDCGKVPPDGTWTPRDEPTAAFLAQFASRSPASARTSGLLACLRARAAPPP